MGKKIVWLVLVAVSLIRGQDLFEQQIYPKDLNRYELFGGSIAVADSFMFVGCKNWNNYRGCVFIFKREGENFEYFQRIESHESQEYEYFGTEVEYSKGKLFVGENNKRISTTRAGIGVVHIYEYDGNIWSEIQAIPSPEPQILSYFGHSISVWGNKMLVGADRYRYEGVRCGMTFLYEYENGEYKLKKEFHPFDYKYDQNFGYEVLLRENHIVITSPLDSTTAGYFAGSVYYYVKTDSTDWKLIRKILPRDHVDFYCFGVSLAMDEESFFVGSIGSFHTNTQGKVYEYKYSGYNVEYIGGFTSGEETPRDCFGVALCLKGDSLLIGAHNTLAEGAAYLFEREGNGWKKLRKILPSDPEIGKTFGSRVSFYGDEILITATGADEDRGKVYRYTTFPTPVKEIPEGPKGYSLSQNYPNPFNPSTVIGFSLPRKEHVRLKVYDVLGKEVAILVNNEKESGSHSVKFDASLLSSGIYLCKISAGRYYEVIKMLLVK